MVAMKQPQLHDIPTRARTDDAFVHNIRVLQCLTFWGRILGENHLLTRIFFQQIDQQVDLIGSCPKSVKAVIC